MKTTLLVFLAVLLVLPELTAQVSQQWASTYNSSPFGFGYPKGVAVDNLGNVYVTGTADSTTSADIATVKYNSSGVMQWVKRYDGASGGFDDAVAIAVDVSGNVIVAGTTEDPASGNDFVVVKYNPSGVLQWSKTYNGPGNVNDVSESLALDDSANVFIAGNSNDGSTGTDIAVVKYNSAGTLKWATRYDNLNEEEFSAKVRIGKNRNIYVGASTYDSSYNYLILKYNPSGIFQWSREYNGPSGLGDECTAIELDTLENVYVTGNTTKPNFYINIATLKYNSSGSLQWTAIYADTSDNATDISIDNSGNVYVCGSTQNFVTFAAKMVLLKYNNSGAQQWVRNLSNGSSDNPVTVLNDNTGNVYVAIQSYINGTGMDFLTRKYSSAGSLLWNISYSRTGTSNDNPAQMVMDNSGNVYVTGNSFQIPAPSNHYATVKYSQIAGSNSVLTLTAFIEGFYNSTSNAMVSDIAKVSIRNNTSPYAAVDTVSASLSTSGAGTFNFTNAVNGTNYYIVINHRNSIETWSNTGYAFTSGSLAYNFSTSASTAFGSNLKQVDISPVRFTVYGGDVNQDETIDLSDLVSCFNDANNFVTGYVVTDVTGDNFVDLSDITIIFNNSNAFVSVVRP